MIQTEDTIVGYGSKTYDVGGSTITEIVCDNDVGFHNKNVFQVFNVRDGFVRMTSMETGSPILRPDSWPCVYNRSAGLLDNCLALPSKSSSVVLSPEVSCTPDNSLVLPSENSSVVSSPKALCTPDNSLVLPSENSSVVSSLHDSYTLQTSSNTKHVSVEKAVAASD